MVFVKTDMVAKGISQDDIPDNWVGRWANRSFRRRTMTVSGKLTNQFTSEGSLILLPNNSVGSIFSRTTSFVLKMIIFSYMA